MGLIWSSHTNKSIIIIRLTYLILIYRVTDKNNKFCMFLCNSNILAIFQLCRFGRQVQWRASIITDKYMGRCARVWILNNILFSYVKCPITPIPRFLRRHKEKLFYGTLYVFVLRISSFRTHDIFESSLENNDNMLYGILNFDF